MDEIQAAKSVVLAANAAVDAAEPGGTARALERFTTPGYQWRGMHPFHCLQGADAVGAQFWDPLKRALGPVQRRADMFLAGYNQLDGWSGLWVVEMGHLMGMWEAPWLGVTPSRKLGFLRYAEFHRVEGDKIAETAHYVDVLGFFALAGYQTVPRLTGVEVLSPGPRGGNGVLTAPQPAHEGRRTVELISAMVEDLRANVVHSPLDHLDRFWTKDMAWFGPGGIGASGFREGYRRGHAGPFEEGLDYVTHTEHVTRIGEGMFGGFFGYPSLTMRSRGYLGLPASDVAAEMRIVDLYRREGDRLAENWIFIDLPHFCNQMGVDLLARIQAAGDG